MEDGKKTKACMGSSECFSSKISLPVFLPTTSLEPRGKAQKRGTNATSNNWETVHCIAWDKFRKLRQLKKF